MRASKRRHEARKAAREARYARRAAEDREVREAIARMENLAAIERGNPNLVPTTFDELKRRYPGIDALGAQLTINDAPYTLEEAANAGFIFTRGDGKILVHKSVSTGTIQVLAAAMKGLKGSK